MRKILIVIDMQNDFIDGALGSKEAEAIVPRVIEKIRSYDRADIFATLDTHGPDYMQTQEGRFLPVEHCITGTKGHEMPAEIKTLLDGVPFYEKSGFGSVELMLKMMDVSRAEECAIEIVGLCTDVCVVTHALMMKAAMPGVPVTVDASCCAGITPKGHLEAIETMRACQIIITGEEKA